MNGKVTNEHVQEDQMNFDIRKRLERVVDVLRTNSEVNPISNIEQICSLIYLKTIDEEEERRDSIVDKKADGESWVESSFFVRQSSRYRWSSWFMRSRCTLNMRQKLASTIYCFSKRLI